MTSKTLTCLHCGESFFSSLSKETAFCCLGCERIYEILHQLHNQGLAALSQHQSEIHPIENYESLIQQNQLRIYIQGIHCISCLKFIEKLPDLLPGIKEVDYNYFENTILIRIDPDQFQMTPLVQLLYFIGYQFHFVQDPSDLEKLHKKELKQLLHQLAVAGFAAMNIMIFAISIYAGLIGPMAQTFHWISFILFLPILFYSATSFYKGAWRSLQTWQPSIDLPITIAMLSGFVLSTYQLLQKSDAIYFDSLSTFIFLILVSRYLTKKWLYQNTQQTHWSDIVGVNFVDRVDKNSPQQTHQIPVSQIQKGDLIQVPPGQNLAFDGILKTSTARLNTALMTGETYPRKIYQGMKVFAGYQNIEDSILVEVTATEKNTDLGQTLQKVENIDYQKTQLQKNIHKISHILLLTVLGAGILTLVAMPNVEGMKRFLALMIVACPCALAFGTPLALLGSLKEAFQKNIIIQSAHVFDQISKIQNIFFDKTGTLTTGELKISHFEPAAPSDELKSIILGIEKDSHHPIAQVLRNEFSESTPAVVQHTGPLCGFYQQSFYEIRANRTAINKGLMSFCVFKDEALILTCYLEDNLKADAFATVQKLKSQYTVSILSGDRLANVEIISEKLGIDKNNTHSELLPEDKVKFVHSNSMMVGDGANDALSLSKAGIGIAANGALALSLKACDIYLKKPELNSIIELIDILKRGQNKIYRNVAISLFYNVTSGILAILGYMNPLWAAILMPLISITLLASSFSSLPSTEPKEKEISWT